MASTFEVDITVGCVLAYICKYVVCISIQHIACVTLQCVSHMCSVTYVKYVNSDMGIETYLKCT